MTEQVQNPHVAAIAIKVVMGWAPPSPVAEKIVRFAWAGADMSGPAIDLRLTKDMLEVSWDPLDGFSRIADDALHKQLLGAPFEGQLASGWSFSADYGVFGSNSRVEGHYWKAEDSSQKPALWIAEVHGLDYLGKSVGAHNLTVSCSVRATERTQSSELRLGHRFQGAYTYYLVPCPNADSSRWFLIVETPDQACPARKELYADVLALQFVLGTAFYLDVLHGLSTDGSVVARAGGRYGRDHSHRPKTEHVVPFGLVREHWPSVFFEAISRTYRERPDLRLYIVLSFYLDGLASFHVEGRYLGLHVGLEAFAYWLLKAEREEAPELVNKTKWKAWLKANRDAIRSLATEGLEETLFAKITSLAKRRASSAVVETAFRRVGLSIAPEMAEELEEGRNVVVHTAVMFEERQEDTENYLTRLAIVRTMLVALVARVVGYRGAILGWTREYRRPYQEPDTSWWTVDPAVREEALRAYVVEGKLPEVQPSNAPVVPEA